MPSFREIDNFPRFDYVSSVIYVRIKAILAISVDFVKVFIVDYDIPEIRWIMKSYIFTSDVF
jgi:hypothetical protein